MSIMAIMKDLDTPIVELITSVLHEKQTDCHLFSAVFKGLTVWPRRCAQKAILGATEVFFAFLSTVTNTTSVNVISPPKLLCLLQVLNLLFLS